jgi:glutamate synthase domain-containing protein 2
VKETLDRFNLTGKVTIIASGRIINSFDILKLISLGASVCCCARGMMMTPGCIQENICNCDLCVESLINKRSALQDMFSPGNCGRVINFHSETMQATKEIMAAFGFTNIKNIQASEFFRRAREFEIRSTEQVYFFDKEDQLRKNFNRFLN